MSNPDSIIVPLLNHSQPEPQPTSDGRVNHPPLQRQPDPSNGQLGDQHQPNSSNGQDDHHQPRSNKRKKKIDISLKVNSFCLATHARRVPHLSGQRVQSFRRTVRVLQLDHSQACTSLLSWSLGLLLLVIIPILRLFFMKAVSSSPSHQLVFQPLVVIVGIAQSLIAFIFLSQAIRRHGLRGVLFLDAAEEEVMEVQKEYDAIIEKGRILLAKLFIPSFVVYIAFKIWFFTEVSLQPLPYQQTMDTTSLVVVIVLTSLSWIFQTTTFLYTCILFATVCALQELKMLKFKDLLGMGLDPEFYYYQYIRIMKGLQATSRRFRLFLALILTISIVAFLASMYKIVAADRAGINMLLSAEIIILNLVSLSGVGLCLRSSSKLSHLHRRIVKAAAALHATGTFEVTDSSFICSASRDTSIERLDKFCQVQEAWTRRAALVNFLACSSAGISVYGFVLDRFFIHASVGALLTTTWFILGRSLVT